MRPTSLYSSSSRRFDLFQAKRYSCQPSIHHDGSHDAPAKNEGEKYVMVEVLLFYFHAIGNNYELKSMIKN